jgi:hypothetical protein
MVERELAAERFAAGWRDRPIFVAYGGRDWSVRPESVEAGLAILERIEARVRVERFAEEDHFLFFGRRTELLERIGSWMEELETAKGGTSWGE